MDQMKQPCFAEGDLYAFYQFKCLFLSNLPSLTQSGFSLLSFLWPHPLNHCLPWLSFFFPHIVVVAGQLLSCVQLCDSRAAAPQASLSFTISWNLFKLMSIDSVMPSNHLILCHPLLLHSIFLSISLFPWVSSSHQVAKVLGFQLQHQSFQWIFGTDFLWNGLVGSPCNQGTLKSLLQHHSSKALILWCLAFLQSNSHIQTWLLEKP